MAEYARLANYASVHVPKAYSSWLVYLCVYLYVCKLDFSKVSKNQALSNAVQAQRDYLELNIFLNYKALFSSYGMICSPQTLLWHIPKFPDDQSACS